MSDIRDEVRIKLFELYNSKNESHIRNIYSLIATFFGLIITDGLKKLSEFGLKISFLDMVFIILTMGIYFFIRVRFWSTMASGIWNIKPVKANFADNQIYIDNVLGELNRGCIRRIETQDQPIILRSLVLLSMSKWFKYYYWIMVIAVTFFLSWSDLI